MCAISFALVFGSARYGTLGAVVGLIGLVPLVVLRWAAWRRRRVKPIGGIATPLALLALNALALSAAIVTGVPNLGPLDVAVWAAGIFIVLWLHAIGSGHLFWGVLAVLATVAAIASLGEGLFVAGLAAPQATVDVWWRSGWGAFAPGAAVCAVIALVVKSLSRRWTERETAGPTSFAPR